MNRNLFVTYSNDSKMGMEKSTSKKLKGKSMTEN